MSQTPVDFVAEVISGSNVVYAWFVNQNKVTDTRVPTASITFSHAGNYQINVRATNAFSSAEATITVQIDALLSGNLLIFSFAHSVSRYK